MVGTKSRGYSNSGRLSVGEYSGLFFSTHNSPNFEYSVTHKVFYYRPRNETFFVKYATFPHFHHIISIKVVVFA